MLIKTIADMKCLTIAALLFVAGLSIAEKYTDKYDNIDVDEILENRKLLVPYIKCVLDEGRCTPDGKELKAHIKDGMQTACAKCTDKQKVSARKIVKHIKQHEADYWEQMKAKYDPKDEFKEIYEGFLAGQN
ncbi:hypothetical protein CDL44_28925 [Escherichia coli]|nr:A10/OS-D family protein [Escherichia coli]OXJ53890.1 hypothetical protein CDL52_26245 [Escherichia coli]OXK02915.1 hypothetical protein CDL44_28925 [Escherichia coli]OXK24772.1 hypothetical protein CDL41_26040 [Escherichia coli]OXK51692.1 hypothetical protein CDL36_29000 [Escherichia coli]